MRLSIFSIILHHTSPHSLTSFVLTVLLYIHRQYFTRVMTENPNNPLDSPYAASVLATFRCAVTVLQVIRNCLIKQPILMARFWLCWSQLMTSAVSTSLSVRSTCFPFRLFLFPSSHLSPFAFEETRRRAYRCGDTPFLGFSRNEWTRMEAYAFIRLSLPSHIHFLCTLFTIH